MLTSRRTCGAWLFGFAVFISATLAPAQAQIAYRGGASASISSGSSLTINVPSGTAANDVMIASITFRPCSSNNNGSCTTSIFAPFGWTQVDSIDQTRGGGTGGYGLRLYVYQRVATAGEPASYAWGFGGSPALAGAVGGILSFSGVDTSNPIVAGAGQTTGTGQDHAAPSINTGSVTNTMLLSTHAALSSGTWTPPNGMTERVDRASRATPNDLGISLEMNTAPFSGSGNTGIRTATLSNPPEGDRGAGHMLALRPATARSISGTVFEDVNYGGGAGRPLATALAAGGSGRSGARVELFNSAGTLVASTTTNAGGSYTFSNLSAGSYTVRVVNSTVSSGRTGYYTGLAPVQTFRTDASSGTADPVTDHVGGENPALADAGNATTTLAALTTSTTTAQSISPVTLGASNVTGVDFGFNFSTIVNVGNTGQGSLRQFINNANALGGKTALAQSGSRVDLSGSTVALPAGMETSIFMIPSGAATPGHGTSHANQLTGGVAIISLTTALPTLTAANVALDGSTQTANVGDTNSGFAGTGGTVGTRGLVLAQIPKPEVQIVGANALNYGIYSTAASTIVRGFAIRGFGSQWLSWHADIRVGGANALVELNMLGTTATSFSDPGSARSGSIGVVTEGNNTTVRNNLIGWIGYLGIAPISGTGVTVSGNEIRSVDQSNSGCCGDGIGAGQSTTTVSGNLIIDGGSAGVDPVTGTYTITDNTITGNGVATSVREPWGIWVRSGASTITYNVVADNYGAGVVVTGGGTRANLSQNSIYGNGSIVNRNNNGPTNALGIDLGNNGVTVNDGAKQNWQPNVFMDYPVLTAASLSGTTLTLAGYVGSAPNQSTFGSSRVEFFASDNDPSGYGEGRTYLGSLTANANGTFSGTLTVSGIADGTRITATATDANGNTSEFGPHFAITGSATAIGSFNAFEPTTPANAVTGVIKTKIAGQPFTLDIVALNSGRTAYVAADVTPITVELLDASSDAGALNATTNCRSSWTTIATVTTTFSMAVGNNGRKSLTMSLGQAHRNLRVRISTTAGSSPSGCSTDNFAVRPAAFVSLQATDSDDMTAGTTRALNNTSATSGVVHRAGRPFSVLALAVNADATTTTPNYDGAPTLNVAACVTPSGCAAGALGSTLTATNGTIAGTATYNEAGVITVTISDTGFAAVDSADSSASERTIALASPATFGRFVPNAYLLASSVTPSFAPPCSAAPTLVFVGQPFSFGTVPVVIATPIDASGTALNNARPRFVAAHVSSTFNPNEINGISAATVSTSSASPLASITYDTGPFSYTRTSTPVASFTPTISLTVSVADTTETATAGNGVISSAPFEITPINFTGGAPTFHYGRIALRPTFGDLRRDLVVPLEVQSYNGTGWVPLTAAAGCVSAGATTFAYSNPTGALASGSAFNCGTRVASTVTTTNGRAAISLAKPANTSTTLPSAMTMTLNLGATASGSSCAAIGTSTPATTANIPWLALPNGDNPSARVTWNRVRGDYIGVRERFD